MPNFANLKLRSSSNRSATNSIAILAVALISAFNGPAFAGTKPSAPKSVPSAPARIPAAPASRPGLPATRPGSAPGSRPGPAVPNVRPEGSGPGVKPSGGRPEPIHTGPNPVIGRPEIKPPAPPTPVRPVLPDRPPIHPPTPANPVAKSVRIDPGGRVTTPVGSTTKVLPNGHKEIATPDGTKIQTNAAGKATSISKPDGTTAHLNPTTGKVTSIRKVGPDGSVTNLHNSPTGVRRVETMRKDSYGSTVHVVSRGNVHYQEKDLVRRPGYVQRTYVTNNRTTVVIYHNTTYLGYAYPVYVDPYYYGPAYYGWYASPWVTPVPYGWGAYPGYGFYGAYFAPAPVYSSPDVWMADYILAENLKAAYAAQQAAAADAEAQASAEPQAAPPAPISPDVRAAYVQEVQQQIKAQQAQASGQAQVNPVPGALSPENATFQAFSEAEAENDGEVCALTGGDFVHREENTPDAKNTVAVTVTDISRNSPSHCPAHSRVRISVDTLQEWYNSQQEILQAGMEKLNSMAGKDGFPAPPAMAKVTNPNGQGIADDPKIVNAAVQEQQASASALQAEVQPGNGQ